MKQELISNLLHAAAFAVLGLTVFAIAFWIMEKVTPFSLRKELETDQNVALAIVVASVILGLSLIISHAVS